MSPSSTNARSAFCTVPRLKGVCRVSSVSVGSLSPVCQCPEAIAAISISRSCAYLGSPATLGAANLARKLTLRVSGVLGILGKAVLSTVIGT